jgi:hypothetical protein
MHARNTQVRDAPGDPERELRRIDGDHSLWPQARDLHGCLAQAAQQARQMRQDLRQAHEREFTHGK